MTEKSSYAIIETGGKQYRVTLGQKVCIEKLAAQTGDEVSIDKVLMLSHSDGTTAIGNPYVQGASVKGKVLGIKKDKKVKTCKRRIKTGYLKRQAHRQKRTELLIENISA